MKAGAQGGRRRNQTGDSCRYDGDCTSNVCAKEGLRQGPLVKGKCLKTEYKEMGDTCRHNQECKGSKTQQTSCDGNKMETKNGICRMRAAARAAAKAKEKN